jgi:hypothetical protein
MRNITAHRLVRFGLEIIEISPTEWRISDADAVEHDALALVGFIEQTDAGFEVTEIGLPGRRVRFDDFDAALQRLRPPHEM